MLLFDPPLKQGDQAEKVPSEPYPELDLVLKTFTAGIQNALKEIVVGAYLVGSLATGDFDLDSDVDFLVVTNAELSDAERRLVQPLHVEIHDLDYHPAKHLEGSYMSRACQLGLSSSAYSHFGTLTMEVAYCSLQFTIIDGTFDGFSGSARLPSWDSVRER